MSDVFDCVVVGVGGVGSAAAYHAARQGWRTLAIDQFSGAHDRGSSHGKTRIIRQAYFEHPHYVPLAQRAYQLWHEVERESGRSLLRPTGLLQIGRPNSFVIRGTIASAQAHGLAIDSLTAAAARRRFPAFSFDDEDVALYEHAAGVLLVEDAVATHQQLAERRGVRFAFDTQVRSLEPRGHRWIVTSDRGDFETKRLIVTAGPWAGRLVEHLAGWLRVTRQPQFWFTVDDERLRADAGSPAYLKAARDGRVFYGFPVLGSDGLKAARHGGGDVVADPFAVDRVLHEPELAEVAAFVRRLFPQANPRLRHHSVCLYTMSPDEHFIVDTHPRFPNLAFAAGLSGHGFKFTPVLGQHLVRLVNGEGDSLLEFLRSARLAHS